MKVAIWVLTLVASAGMAVSLNPDWLGLSTYLPFAQVVAVRGIVAAALAALALILLLVVAALRQRGGKARALITLAVVAMLVAAGHGGILTSRMYAPNPQLIDDDAALTALTFNTYGKAAVAREVAALVIQEQPQVVSLQEVSAPVARQIADLAAEAGLEYQVFTASTTLEIVSHTALLVAAQLGEYEQQAGPETTFATVVAAPTAAGSGPVLAAVHTAPPLPKLMAQWRSDLTAVMELCEQQTNIVLAGDFNATKDHGPLADSDCTVATAATASTWPATQSQWLGATIDHVLASGGHWLAGPTRTVQIAGSDHRAVIAALSPAR